jgi:hypothetical protein
MQIKLKHLKYGDYFIHNDILYRKLTQCQDMETFHAGNDRPKHEMCFAHAIAFTIKNRWFPACKTEPLAKIPQSDLLTVEHVNCTITVEPM